MKKYTIKMEVEIGIKANNMTEAEAKLDNMIDDLYTAEGLEKFLDTLETHVIEVEDEDKEGI